MQNKISYTALLGYETNFSINWLFFEPINKNMQMHTIVGPNNN